MTNRIGIASNKKILDLYNAMKSGELVLRPRFQRKLVWNDQHKENFLETILRGLPFPEIYLAAGEIDLETQKSKTLVVDGQQRLNTIYDYIRGSEELAFKKIPLFKKLSDKDKTNFYDYQVVVRDLERIDDEKLIEIFSRINSVGYALNAVEINNALYEGEFITCAKEILEMSFFKDIDIFSETEYSRMKDLEFILLIMSTLEEKGYFSGIKEVETYIKKYDSEYPIGETMKANFINCLSLFADLAIPPDSIWFRKASFFTLITELLFFKNNSGFFPDKKDLRLKLISLEERIIKDKTADPEKNKYAKYYNYVFSGTGSRTARIARGELIRESLQQGK